MRAKQKGFIGVVMLSILTGLIASLIFLQSEENRLKTLDLRTDESGRHLQEYVVGVQKYLSEQGLASSPGTYTGVSWLKGPACGGTNVDDYIANCAMNDKNTFGEIYTTVITVSGGIASGEIRTPWPRNDQWNRSGSLASRVRAVANSYLSGSVPVAQAYSEYSLDSATQEIVAQVGTAPNNDIYWRTDGSNQMNADGNMGGNSIYGVAGIYTNLVGATPGGVALEIGSAMNARGVITVESPGGTGSSFINVLESNSSGYSLEATGAITSNGADFFSRVTVGDGSTPSSAEIEFTDQAVGSASNVIVRGDNGDLVISNGNDDATIISDKIYYEAINRYGTQALFNLTVANIGDEIPKPTCPDGLTPQIFTAIDGIKQDPARPFYGFDIDPIDNGNSWTIELDHLTDLDGAVVEAQILVMPKCS